MDDNKSKNKSFVAGLVVGSIITGAIGAGLIYYCTKENETLVNDYNNLHDNYNLLVKEWNEKIATKHSENVESPNPHWKNYNPGHLSKQKADIFMISVPSRKNSPTKTYINAADGLAWTVINGTSKEA